VDFFIGLFMLIPFLEEPFFHFRDLLRGNILPIMPNVFYASIVIASIFLAILSLGMIQRRYWCRHLCPLGALLGFASKWRLYRRTVSDKCTECGICRKHCRMDAIPEDFHQTKHIECISCMDCQSICPVDAVHFRFARNSPTRVDFSKRKVLAAGAAGILSVGLLKVGYINPEKRTSVIRPPGTLEESAFLQRCVRCGECIRICSSTGAGLHHTGLESGWEGIWTPLLRPKVGYCDYNCNLCGQVCPTGAIKPLPLKERQKIRIGNAYFDKTRCIPWYYGENCMVCEEYCPLPDKAIKFQESKFINTDGKESELFLPYIDESHCIGCGICVYRCPVEGQRGIFLTNANEERRI
jgi:ferredoxin